MRSSYRDRTEKTHHERDWLCVKSTMSRRYPVLSGLRKDLCVLNPNPSIQPLGRLPFHLKHSQQLHVRPKVVSNSEPDFGFHGRKEPGDYLTTASIPNAMSKQEDSIALPLGSRKYPQLLVMWERVGVSIVVNEDSESYSVRRPSRKP